MRLIVLSLASLLALAACAGEPDAPTPASSSLEDARPVPTATPVSVRMDSLRIDDEALRFHVRIGYPVLDGVPEAINAAIRDSVTAFAEAFRPTELPDPDADPFGSTTTVEGGTTVEQAGPDVFSAVVDVYAFSGGAHGNTSFLPFTVDLQTGAWLALGDVLADGPALRASLAEAVTRAVVDRLTGEGGMTPEDALAEVAAYNAGGVRFEQPPGFTLGPDSLVLHIPPYEVGPYAIGSFRVPVALSALAAFAREGAGPR